ncbi:ribosome small subunit-dependent GTPase A [Amaricoccus sp.]|uniref:ribosome small subunit-dependent GTPase A n=1 Tax=Amaricoccus sp. TaxID=1872485 RepID=UPI001B7933CE|nr:ribosome small subunit-dependent GTPase A [Amaricoccus sp.]MBP7241789.1 ribosome small subunit-dependent GTPase A [Amaricoccus sp.]
MTPALSLRDLGWSPFLQAGLAPDDLAAAEPMRVAAVHRTGVDALGADGPRRLATGALSAAEIAVGDWLLAGRDPARVLRLLPRKSLVTRRAAGTGATLQLVAANLDTLFVVTSCNADFNVARIERYLALARQAGAEPVVVLTKADACPEPEAYVDRVRALSRALQVEAVNVLDPASAARLEVWCGRGETVALAGSSGVGKSTLAGALTGARLATAPIREDDARGRHTTTSRSLIRTRAGGWLIDTPGMRALRLADAAEGVAATFDDIGELARRCRFADCAHDGEPGCAVGTAIAEGALDPGRLARWRKLAREEARNSATLAEARRAERGFGRMARRAMAEKRARRGDD